MDSLICPECSQPTDTTYHIGIEGIGSMCLDCHVVAMLKQERQARLIIDVLDNNLRVLKQLQEFFESVGKSKSD